VGPKSPCMTTIDRRTFLRGAAAGVGASALLATPLARALPLAPRVYVLVVDGLRPDEVDHPLMPTLASLRDQGTSYLRASAVHVAETIPNHAAMMTGVLPDRNGVPANDVFFRDEGVAGHPREIAFRTVLEQASSEGLVTATVLSKRYLYDLFDGLADHQWDGDQPPQPNIPVSDHVPDPWTMDATIEVIDRHDPDLVFVNLGDVDRSGHSDPSGPLAPEVDRTVRPEGDDPRTSVPAFRTSVLASTDLQLRRFVEHLTSTGRWDSSVVLVVADHSMDWSVPHKVVSLTSVFDDAGLAGTYRVVQNGGADLVYVVDGDRPTVLHRMRAAALAHPGVASVHDPVEYRLGPLAGDLIAFVHPGWRFTDPAVHSNPIPGNHGHPVTLDIPFIVAGGHPIVRRGVQVADVTATNLDVAPTVGWLLGLDDHSSDGLPLDGVARREAFVSPGSVRRPPAPPGRQAAQSR
jgi:ectonucleotide pyrophosphatase/phosphodiesterase family member 5